MIVFLLGTPGCGKSEFYRRLTKRFKEEGMYDEFPRVDDFPKLWNIFMEDEKSGKWERCRKTDDGGYKVTDPTVWDDILKEVNKDILELKSKASENSIIFIEFSRPNYVHSITNNFSEEILKDSIAVYMDVPFEVCWERNVRRHEKALDAGSDDHLVSREEMEETYGSDDKGDLEEKLPFPVVFIYPDSPDPDDFTKLEEGIEKTIKVLKGEEAK
ncbi:MAG: AAA family ATPase [Elusimicrobia bacterium]|nr:AAA family ATPase [Elusimicrobiota bacterium]